jgi:hypothetical protein
MRRLFLRRFFSVLACGCALTARTVAAAGSSAGIGVTVTLTNDNFVFRAVDKGGTAYATNLSQQSSRLWASTDNARTWSYRGTAPNNSDFKELAPLESGALLADTQDSSGNFNIARSSDQGATWVNVLPLGQYRLLSTRNVVELGGTVYLLEYQAFTTSSVPIALWASTDDGQSWSVRHTFQGHRHGHTIRAAPDGSLWAFFGDSDSQAGIYRSTDGGNSWSEVLAGPTALGDDAIFLSNGTALFGQDISNLPDLPFVVTLTPGGVLTEITRIPGPAYSIQATPAGGYLLGETWEPNDTVYAAGDTSAHLLGSPDGVSWSVLGSYPTSNTSDYGRADVYWALKTGEVVLTLSNVTTVASTAGYELLQVNISGGGTGSDAGNGGAGSDAGSGGTGSDAGSGGTGSDAGSGGTGSDAGSGGGTTDAGSPESFSDTFASCTATSGLDSSWLTTGTWYCKGGFARSESAGGLALARISLASDQTIKARVQLTGVATGSGVVARATASHFYLARLQSNGTVEVDRVDNGVFTSLAAFSTPIASNVFYSLTLGVAGTGTGGARLVVSLNGAQIATATDPGSSLTGGAAGLYGGSTARTQYNDVTISSP